MCAGFEMVCRQSMRGVVRLAFAFSRSVVSLARVVVGYDVSVSFVDSMCSVAMSVSRIA